MRIQTIYGPPLPAEIAEQAARAIALQLIIDQQSAHRHRTTQQTL